MGKLSSVEKKIVSLLIVMIIITIISYIYSEISSASSEYKRQSQPKPIHNSALDNSRIEYPKEQNKHQQEVKDVPVLFNEQSEIDLLESIRRDCGELCNTSRQGSFGPYFNHIRAHIDCPALFQNEYVDRPHGLTQAPNKIPKELMDDFTMSGQLKVKELYFNQTYLGKKALAPKWTREMVEQSKSFAKQGTLPGNYGISETNALRDGLKHAPGVRNGRVLVIGSETPWVEACVLEAGAKEIVTLEYGEIISEHEQIETMTPLNFRKRYQDGTLGKFDAIVTFSSVEHSGLGRYGDALNPWGDIIAIARAWCVTKDEGSLTIGVMYDYNNDFIRFNADRWYGKKRYPYLATNWRQHYLGQGHQRVHVFTKGNSETDPDLYSFLKEPNPYRSLNNTDIKHSHAKQDVTVYNLLPKEGGFFIEMGAFYGVTYSNTLWLEQHHNWSGLLIEANPDICNKLDNVNRCVWRMCACISSEKAMFIRGGTFKSAQNPNITVQLPCFKLDRVLNTIKQTHIDYFSLDVKGEELFILNTFKSELQSSKIVVDIWTITYRVWDGSRINVDKSKGNFDELRHFFKEIGGYAEHSQLSDTDDISDGMALDVVFVNTNTWCKNYKILPNGKTCKS